MLPSPGGTPAGLPGGRATVDGTHAPAPRCLPARLGLRALRKLVLLLVIVGLLLGADLATRRAVESELANRIRDHVSAEQGVAPGDTSVHISSFPFLARLGTTGDVKTLSASVSDVEVEGFRFATISVDLHDVHIDRESLVFDRQVVVKRIGSGEATADITQAALRNALDGLPLVLGPGTIGVTLGGLTVSVSARVTNSVLQLSAAGIDLPAIALPKTPLLPCLTQAEARRGLLHVTCTVRRVPTELVRRASAPSARGPLARRPAVRDSLRNLDGR